MSFPSDFDLDALSKFMRNIRPKRKIGPEKTDEEVLVLRHLGRFENGAFVPNIACALLFVKDPGQNIPGCKIRFQRFEGKGEQTGQKYNAVKDAVFEGTVPQLIAQIESTLESQLRTFSPLNEKVRFLPVAEYPKEAWYEAIINAAVHRSYGNGMKNLNVFVKMFDDRLEIESPGPFMAFVTPENIYKIHAPRNPHLMDAMFYLDYVLCAHEGARRIRDSMFEAGLPPPLFSQERDGFSIVRVVLRNDIERRRVWIERDVRQIISDALAADLADEENRIVNWLAEHGTMTVSDTNKMLAISWQTARKLLLGLTRKRILQYIRFRGFEKNQRDPKAFFRLRSTAQLPVGAFEADPNIDAESDEPEASSES